MGPELALESRNNLIRCLLDERQSWAYESWAMMRDPKVLPGTPDTRYTTEAVRYTLATALQMSDCFWVTNSMIDLLEHAAPQMPAQALEPMHLPVPLGYVRLERPVVLPLNVADTSGDEQSRQNLVERMHYSEEEAEAIVNAQETSVGVTAFSWLDFKTLVEQSGFDDADRAKGIMVSAFFRPYDDVTIEPPELEQLRSDNLPKWLLLDTYLWEYGQDWARGENWASRPDSENGIFGTTWMSRLMATFWTLIDQELSDVTVRRAPRHVVRRSEREGFPPSNIKVVTLRRRHTHAEPTGEGREYSHQWVVSGHWRNQPWGPGREKRRLQWIAPYVKGPEDKELVVKDTVFSWQR